MQQQELLETLRADRSSLKQREAQLARLEAEHREVLAALERKLDREDRDSQRAQARLAELEELITRLERAAAAPAAAPAGTPLARRKGRLRWPLSGPLLRRYGSRNWLERSRGTLVGSPPGTAVAAVHPGTVDIGAGLLAQGLRIASPIVGTMFIVQLGMGLVARSAPRVQIFALTFAVTSAVGAAVLYASLPAVVTALTAHLGELPAALRAALGGG